MILDPQNQPHLQFLQSVLHQDIFLHTQILNDTTTLCHVDRYRIHPI